MKGFLEKFMMWLGPMFGGMAVQMMDLFWKSTTKKVAVWLAAFAIFMASVMAVYAFVWASFLTIIVSMPPALSDMLRFLLPGNVYLCLSLIFSSHICIIGFGFFVIKFNEIAKTYMRSPF